MDASRWARESVSRVRTNGIDGVRESLRPVYHKALHAVSRLRNPGTPIYEPDWNLLVVVDACRLDLMREAAPAYEFIDDVGSIRSIESTTQLWMRKNFTQTYSEEMAETAYVCGNPFSAQELDANAFHKLDEVWRDVWEEPGTVPPRSVTDRAIRAARERDPERFIVHYLQPHWPFISRPELVEGPGCAKFGHQEGLDVWEMLRAGELDREEVWTGYRENLQLALNEVKILLENVDAETAVVTSDHGNALGEWMVYGHPARMPLNCLRVVPWIETTAIDRGTHEPVTHGTDTSVDRSEQLAALGYM